MARLFLWFAAILPVWCQSYMVTTVAGKGRIAFSDEGGRATEAQLMVPDRLAVDTSGNLYISDTYFHRVFKVTPAGIITTVAGTGEAGYSGDGGAAARAQLSVPVGLAVDSAGNLYIADLGNDRIRRVSRNGVITTVAGSGEHGFRGDGGQARSAALADPRDVAVDEAGSLYIADSGNQRVRRVAPDGTIGTVAGTGTAGFSGDRGPATAARLNSPAGVSLDGQGNLYILDDRNFRVRRVNPAGNIDTVAGNGTCAFAGDTGLAVAAQICPASVQADAGGNLYIADYSNSRVRKVDTAGYITTVAGSGTWGSGGDGGPATRAEMLTPSGVAVDRSGSLYIADLMERRVRRVNASGTISTVAGVGPPTRNGDGGDARDAWLLFPTAVAADADGNLYIADADDNRVRRMDASGTITTLAGTGQYGFRGDGGQARQATLAAPSDVLPDGTGGLLVGGPYYVRRVASSGIINRVAGSGARGSSGDGGPATLARLGASIRVAIDAQGNTYVSDGSNHRIRKVTASGMIFAFAGTGTAGLAGDGGPAADAQLNGPAGLAVGPEGEVYIADAGNGRIRKVDAGGTITTVASGAPLDTPTGLALDAAGNLYIADTGTHQIHRMTPDGTVSTIAGVPEGGFSGDGGPAHEARFCVPSSVAVDPAGNIFVADQCNYRVRKLQPVQVLPAGVVNIASRLHGPLAPGEIVAIGAAGIGPAERVDLTLTAEGAAATELGNTRVLVDGVAVPLLYAARGEVAAIIPYAVAGKSQATLRVETGGHPTNAVTLPVAAAFPGIFTTGGKGSGQALALNEDGSSNAETNPAAKDSLLTLFVTGDGQSDPPGTDGAIAGESAPRTGREVTVTLAGMQAEVVYAGGAQGLVAGFTRVTVRIPADLEASGAVPVVLRVGEAVAQEGVTVAVR